MAERKRGIIFRVHEKEWQGKSLYSFKFDGGGQNDWFRLGEDRKAGVIKEGWDVEVEFEEDHRGNKQVQRARVHDKNPVKKTHQSNNRGGNRGGGSARDDYWKQKDAYDKEVVQPRITYQAALGRAIEFVDVVIKHECIKLPAKSKVKERQEVIEGLLDVYTARFYRDAFSIDEAVGRGESEATGPQSVDSGGDDIDWDEESAEAVRSAGGNDAGGEWS